MWNARSHAAYQGYSQGSGIEIDVARCSDAPSRLFRPLEPLFAGGGGCGRVALTASVRTS